MVSDPTFVQFVVDQIEPDLEITFRKMFGEYGIWSKGKIVALICDNKLFVKPTDAGKKFIGNFVEAPPYPGAKMWLLIQDEVENRKWLTQMIRITENAIPAAKKKK